MRRVKMKAFSTMLKTELRLSLRGMDMFIFAICMPVVVMAIIGVMYSARPAFEGAGYTFLEQSFGAVATIAICAGGMMGLPLVVSDYRHHKVLRRFKVTPTSPGMILAVQIAIYAIYSFASLALVYLVASVFFGYRMNGSRFAFFASYLLVMASMFSIGMLVGGVASNAKTAGIVASLLYFPTMIFSGATLPYESMPVVLQKVADFLPLTQGIKLIKAASLGLSPQSYVTHIAVMAAIAVVCVLLSVKFFKWE